MLLNVKESRVYMIKSKDNRKKHYLIVDNFDDNFSIIILKQNLDPTP